MNLLMCVNDGYVYPLLNLMYSVRKYNKDEIDLYILSTRLEEKNQHMIKSKLKEIDINAHISVLKVEEFEVAKNQHYTYDMFLRIFAFDILPRNLDKILYIDADMLAVDDVSKIYNTDLKNKLMGVVRDFGVKFKKVRKYVDSLNVEHTYFNSGMILMNISKMRENWDRKNIEDFIQHKAQKLSFPDQDVLNLLCSENDVLMLDSGFNYQVKNNEKVECDKVVLLHYVGYNKPWNHYILAGHEKLFWDNFKELNLPQFYKERKKFRRIRLKMLFYKVINKMKNIFKKHTK